MIGTNIRSIRHLYRMSDASLRTVLIRFKETAWEACKVIKTPKNSPFGETMFIFNNVFRQSHWGFDTLLSSEFFKKGHYVDDMSNFSRVVSISPSEFSSLNGLFTEIILLPDSFDKDYEKFLKENSKMINNLMSNYGINVRDVKIKRMYVYADGSKNFFQWAVNVYFKNGVALSTIKNILCWNESYKQLAKNLSRGTITAYTSKDSIIPLLGELSELRKEKRINDSINSFNTAQKKMLKENQLTEDVKQALWRLSRLSDTKRLNFIKKMSSVTDFNEFIRQLKFVTSVHFSWSKDSFMDFINNVEGIKYEKIYENDTVVLIKALDYETIKQLGKTTNWCISKNKHYWNNYIENYHGQTTQYMVFDFSRVEDDKLSIIGFTTTHNKGITSAHNFINEDLMNSNNEQTLLTSFIGKFKENRNIYSILNELGVDVTLVVEYDKPQYEWNKDSVLNYLYECVNPENVDTLMSKDNKMVLSITDQNICYFFGDTYHDNIPSEFKTLQHIVFIDFNKSKYDINKIQFGIIEEGYGDEDYCNNVFNERSLGNGKNFDSLLIEFGLPYNTIRRTNNPIIRLRNAITSFNKPMMDECMKDCTKQELKHVIREEIGSEAFYDYMIRSIENYMSFDYLNLIYDNGLKLKDIISIGYIGDFIKHFAQNIRAISRATDNFANLQGVTDDEIKDFYNLNLTRREDTKYVGFYLAIKKVIENESCEGIEGNELYKRFLSHMESRNAQVDVYEQIVDLFKDKLDYDYKSNAIICLTKYAVFYGSQGLKDFINKKSETNSFLKEQIEFYTKEYKKITGNKDKKVTKATINSSIYTRFLDEAISLNNATAAAYNITEPIF